MNDTSTLRNAIARGQRAILSARRPDGAWNGTCELGPSCTAQVLVALSYMGRLDRDDANEGARWLRNRQHKDGSFGGWPFAKKGDLGTTATAWAALSLSTEEKEKKAATRALAWVEKNGGLDKVVALAATGDVSAIYLALAGKLDPKRLQKPPIAWALVPQIVAFAMTRFNFTTVLGALSLGIIARRLTGDWSVLTRLSVGSAVDAIATFQNTNGSFNCVTIATAIFGAALHATGRPQDRLRAERAAAWLLTRRIRDASGMHFDIFPSDVWTTAYHVRVLVESGVPRSDEAIIKGVEHLLRTQSNVPMPVYDNPKPHAVLTGGWAFEEDNPIMPDPDDCAVVLSALGVVLEKSDQPLPDSVAERVRRSVADGRRWLLGMQNSDGGWAGFATGLPGKRPGPAMTTPFTMPSDPLGFVKMFVDPPVILGDPSTEDLSARVIDALSSTGDTSESAQVKAALSFLREQQTDFGPWWGRWVVNYLAGTAYVLSALAKSRQDLSASYVKRAIDWVIAQQNEDGGWGESVETYADPKLAGKGPSTAPLTGLVLIGLCDAGMREHKAVERGLAYLLSTQRPDGTWPNGSYLATALPPFAFYTYAPAANYLPLQALARFEFPAHITPAPSESRWTNAVLDPMRQQTDPLADALVEQVYAAGGAAAANPLLMKLFHNDSPIPDGLPPELRAYFENTAALPAWADPAKIADAQKLFAEFPVQITMGLFCSSLPQAYAAANGAAVLVQTQALERHVKQRVFETAQFIFDVLDEGSLLPSGKGIRAAQRVRLMHAAIRYMILRRKDVPWDVAVLGKPINQEDMAGTLMTFSALTFDALRRYGFDVEPKRAEAWIHHWTVVGHFLGLDRSLFPTSLADAEALMEAIRRRQWAPSKVGKDLTAALLEMMNGFFTFDLTAFKGVMPTQIRFLAGDLCADLLGVPPSNLSGLLEVSSDLLKHIEWDHEADLAEVLGKIAFIGMKGIILAEREGKQASFRLPESLRKTVIPGT